jgi:hypothetical protein
MRSLSLRSPYRLTCFCSANAPGLPRPCSLYPCCPAHVVACRVPTLARSSHTPTLDHARSIHAQSTRSIQGSHSPCPTSLGSRSLGPRSFRLQSFAAAAAHAAARAAPARTASARAAPALAAPARPTWTCGYRGMDRRARQACRAAHARTSMRGGGGGPHEQRKHCEMYRESMRIEKWPWRERCWRRGRQGRLRRTRWPCPRLCPENTFETGAQQV